MEMYLWLIVYFSFILPMAKVVMLQSNSSKVSFADLLCGIVWPSVLALWLISSIVKGFCTMLNIIAIKLIED